jgi:orotidine-5'-phosphate decarboxylase
MTCCGDHDGAGHAADRLAAAVRRHGAPACVGLDPVAGRLPTGAAPASRGDEIGAIADFCLGVLDSVCDHVPAIKLQSACFERYGPEGIALLRRLIGEAHDRGLQAILDAKRGDLGVTAEHYAAAAFEGESRQRCDWLTIQSYLGPDGIRPFLRAGHGAFALVRTSNPGGDRIQAQALAEGGTVAESVARMVAEVGSDTVGGRGYSTLGAVVGATRPREALRLRELMPQQVFLMPGLGAQGASARDVQDLFGPQGMGAMVTASRSVIYAFEEGRGGPWRAAVESAARALADEAGCAAGLR